MGGLAEARKRAAIIAAHPPKPRELLEPVKARDGSFVLRPVKPLRVAATTAKPRVKRARRSSVLAAGRPDLPDLRPENGRWVIRYGQPIQPNYDTAMQVMTNRALGSR